MENYEMVETYDSNFKTISKTSSVEEPQPKKIISYVTLGQQNPASANNFVNAPGNNNEPFNLLSEPEFMGEGSQSITKFAANSLV